MIFEVYVLTKHLSDKNIEAIKSLAVRYGNSVVFCWVDEVKLEGVKFRKNRPLTKAAYYRILLPEILPNDVSQILYLDCDIVVLGSVKELYDIDLEGTALAACRDISPYTELHRRQLNLDMRDATFCSGVMMINVEYWRNIHAEQKLLDYAKQDRAVVYLHDQDALNFVFRNKWFMLPYKWNKTARSYAVLDPLQRYFDIEEYVFTPRVLHFASSLKPWFDVWFPERKFYIKYLILSKYPNPSFIHVDLKTRIKEWGNNCRYYINRFIRPFVPNVLELLIKDVYNILSLGITLLLSPQKLSCKLLSLWLKKYQ